MLTPPSLNNEKELLLQVAEGDQQAFRQLLDHFHTIAFRVVMRLTGDQYTAEDVVQDVFLKVWMKRNTLPRIDNFRSWLITVTANTVYDLIRKQNTEKIHIAGWQHELRLQNSITEITTAGDSHLHELVQQAFATLTDKQRQAFTLIKKEGYSREEAASRMNISPETVKTHIEQAMRTIRTYCASRIDPGSAIVVLSLIMKKYF